MIPFRLLCLWLYERAALRIPETTATSWRREVEANRRTFHSKWQNFFGYDPYNTSPRFSVAAWGSTSNRTGPSENFPIWKESSFRDIDSLELIRVGEVCQCETSSTTKGNEANPGDKVTLDLFFVGSRLDFHLWLNSPNIRLSVLVDRYSTLDWRVIFGPDSCGCPIGNRSRGCVYNFCCATTIARADIGRGCEDFVRGRNLWANRSALLSTYRRHSRCWQQEEQEWMWISFSKYMWFTFRRWFVVRFLCSKVSGVDIFRCLFLSRHWWWWFFCWHIGRHGR